MRNRQVGPSARFLAHAGLVVTLAATLLACADSSPPNASPDDAISRRVTYEQTWQIATHNSYWVGRGAPNDLFASGVGERLLDQLLLDAVRTLEIDIHATPGRPGGFSVFHTVAGNSLCADLAGCLGTLRMLHHALPRHEVVTVVVELKGILEPTFDTEHTIEDLDRVLESELGAMLYRPSDLLARCAARTSDDLDLSSCVSREGWPSLAELRGRVIVTILGNWDELGGAQATRDWVDYATGAPIATRAAFPMASSWKLDRAALPPRLQDLVSQSDLDRAFAQSAFLQIEDLADRRIDPFLARRGVIRVGGASTADDQAIRIARGMQLQQTDYPWISVDGAGPSEPLRLLAGAADGARILEPGARVLLGPPGAESTTDLATVFAYRESSGGEDESWEAVVSSRSGAAACLRVATSLDPDADSLIVCREKTSSGPDAERIALHLEWCVAGECHGESVPGSLDTLGGPGDLLSIEVTRGPSGPGACAQALAADLVSSSGEPQLVALAERVCFAEPLRYRGIARRRGPYPDDGSAVLFTGIRVSGSRMPLGTASFDGTVVVDGGSVRRVEELLRDAAAPAESATALH